MKEILYQYYGIDVVGCIRLTQHVFKIKTQNDFYVAKIVDNNELESMFKNIDTLQISYFVKIILNTYNQCLTPFDNQYIYLMPFIDNDDQLPLEIRMKYYLNFLAHIHHQTSHSIKSNKQYLQQLCDSLFYIIEESNHYYLHLINEFEKIQIRSPSQWFFMMNYYKIFESLKYAKQYLFAYKEYTHDNKHIRVTINYQNFDFKHISIKNSCLLSIDHICIHIPVFDLYNIYQKDCFDFIDYNYLFDNYFNVISYNDDEVILLKCLLLVLPTIELNRDEIDNVILLSQLFHRMDLIEHIIQQI